MAEPTGTLTFEDLILEVAIKLATADYTGSAAAIPTDPIDLSDAKRCVNNGIRMFLGDAPPQGWRWANPTASIDIWPDLYPINSGNLTNAVGDLGNDRTLLTAAKPVFYPTMELKNIVLANGVGHKIIGYVSPTQIYVQGGAVAIPGAGATFTILSDGSFTLPQTFGGQYTGDITFGPGTNRGIEARWGSEAEIRLYRADANEDTGTPYVFAIRIVNGTRRRYELTCWRSPDVLYTILFPYTLYFDKLVELTDVSPAPYPHDETVKAACLAAAERDIEQQVDGPHSTDYGRCLQNSMKIDNQSAPKRLGYVGNPTGGGVRDPRNWRNNFYERPTVTFNG